MGGGNTFLDRVVIDYYVYATMLLAQYFPFIQISLVAFLWFYCVVAAHGNTWFDEGNVQSYFFVTGSFSIIGGTIHGLLWSDTSEGWKFLYYLLGFVAIIVYPLGVAMILGVIVCFPPFAMALWRRANGDAYPAPQGTRLGLLGWLHHLFVHHPAEAPVRRAQSGAIVRQPIDGAELAAAMDRGWLNRLKATFAYRSQARRAERVAEQLDAERELLDAERKIAEAAVERERARQRLDLTRRESP